MLTYNGGSYDGKPKYEDPLNQIQDQVGARIVTFYASDVERIRLEVEKYFNPIILCVLQSQDGRPQD